MRVAGPGESFPLAALLGSGTLITSGEAITEMDVLAIPVAELSALCEREPALGSHVYRSAARSLRHAIATPSSTWRPARNGSCEALAKRKLRPSCRQRGTESGVHRPDRL